MIEAILVFMHSLALLREVGGHIREARLAAKGLFTYLNEQCTQGMVAFHTQFSTLRIPAKDQDGVECRDVVETILKKLQRGRTEWMLVLGPVGSGKTSSLSILFARLAEMKKKKRIKAIPILIRLRDNWNPTDVTATLEAILGRDVCARLLRKRYPFILLLDGLDEYAMQYNQSLALRQIGNDILGAPFLKGCTVIVTSRPNAIRDLHNVPELQRLFPFQYRLFDLQHTDVVNYVATLNLTEAFNGLLKDVRQLLYKPLFLYFFVEAKRGDESVTIANEVQLFDRFYEQWYERSMVQMKPANPLHSADTVRELLEDLAVTVAQSDTDSLTEADIRSAVTRFVSKNRNSGVFVDQLMNQVMQRWLLVPTEDRGPKRYRFLHSSLADYFLCRPLCEDYVSGLHESSQRWKYVGELALLFVRIRLAARDDIAEILSKETLAHKSNGEVNDLHWAISIVVWLGDGSTTMHLTQPRQVRLLNEWRRLTNNHGTSLAGAIRGAVRHLTLTGCIFEDFELYGYNLSEGGDFSRATIRRSNFIGSDDRLKMPGFKFAGATLQDCRFIAVDLTAADLHSARFENCEFELCKMERVNACDATFSRCGFTNCDLAHTQFDRTSFEHTLFEDCTLTGASMDNCKARSSTLRRCDLFQMQVSGFDKSTVRLTECRNIPPQW